MTDTCTECGHDPDETAAETEQLRFAYEGAAASSRHYEELYETAAKFRHNIRFDLGILREHIHAGAPMSLIDSELERFVNWATHGPRPAGMLMSPAPDAYLDSEAAN